MSGQYEGSVFRTLRRLQEHSRSDVPGMIVQRAMSTFTLHREPLPTPATNSVSVMVYPQDPFVGEPGGRRMYRKDIEPGLVNSRVRVEDLSGDLAQPDEDGNYLFWPGMPQFDQVNAFYYTTFTLRMYERYARRAIPWAFPSPRLTILPHVGDQANAFYNEQDQVIGFHTFTTPDGRRLSTAQSADIVSHEAAHAVLDGIRDLYNESFGLGPRAFHESFGDMTAVLVTLHDDMLLHRLLQWTKGDLNISSFVSEVAEQLSGQGRDEDAYLREHTIYLRNAFNRLDYIPFDSLPPLTSPAATQLTRQEHSYSRLFTGAFYDILVGIYDHLKETMPAYLSLYRARDHAGQILITAIELGPVGEFDFSDMARAFLSAESILYGGRYSDILQKVFVDRRLLTQEQMTDHLKTLHNLPDVSLPESLNTSMAAALFLEEVLPKLDVPGDVELLPLAAYRDARGHAYLTYFTFTPLELKGRQYKKFDGSSIHVFGGLTLMFDEQNHLRSVFYRPVTDEDLRQIQILTAELIKLGMVVDHLSLNGMTYPRPVPQGLWVPVPKVAQPPSAQIVKFPVIYDVVPEGLVNLLDYLKFWIKNHDE